MTFFTFDSRPELFFESFSSLLKFSQYIISRLKAGLLSSLLQLIRAEAWELMPLLSSAKLKLERFF